MQILNHSAYFYFEQCFQQVCLLGTLYSDRTSGLGGLEVACWPLVRKFAGSNPAEAVGFFRAKKFSACLSSEGKLSRLSHVVDLRRVKDP